MKWKTVAENWPAFVDPIERRWPETQGKDLLAIGGDRRRFTSYLSKVHDLTRNEANEVIESWLVASAPEEAAVGPVRPRSASRSDHAPQSGPKDRRDRN